MRYLHFISLFTFIGIVLFTITFIIISNSAWDSKNISQKDLNHNNEYTAVKSQIDNGIYFGITTIFLWILLISIQLSE
jgi:magnesium-transporting ATPase (P-type)